MVQFYDILSIPKANYKAHMEHFSQLL